MASLGTQSSPRTDRAVVAIEALVAVTVVSAVIGTSYGPAATVGFLLVGTALAATVTFLWRMVAALRDPALDVPLGHVDDARIALEAEKAILLHGIKELESDSGTGKVDDADYAQLRRVAEARAMEIIREINASDRRWTEEAEALVAKRGPKGKASGKAKAAATDEPARAAAAPASVATSAVAPAPVARAAHAAAHPGVFPKDTARFEPTADGRVQCTRCEATSDLDARFCTGCGRRREAT